MIFLDFHNPAVESLLLSRFNSAKQGLKHEKIDYTVADFDRVIYRLHTVEGDKSKLMVSLLVRFFDELREYDVEGLLHREYGDYLCSQPQPGYSVTLLFDLNNPPQNSEAVAHHVAMLKRNCFAAVFEPFFLLQALAEEPLISKRAVIHYGDMETMYVQALEDRITVIFSTVFKDANDIIIGKIFMQEFTEVRRRYDRAPQVLYSHRVPPAELRGTDAAVGDNMAYITFVLFPRHLAPHAADHTISLIHTVRNYLHYHIKCAKGYLHMRMRAKTAEFVKILNRARPVYEEEPVVCVGALGLDSTSALERKLSRQSNSLVIQNGSMMAKTLIIDHSDSVDDFSGGSVTPFGDNLENDYYYNSMDSVPQPVFE
ncbi:hypothetical protein AAHC03_024555 [Spirometra sp. Aus1]